MYTVDDVPAVARSAGPGYSAVPGHHFLQTGRISLRSKINTLVGALDSRVCRTVEFHRTLVGKSDGHFGWERK